MKQLPVLFNIAYWGRDDTQETWRFIRMMGVFFDCLNVKNPIEHKMKRKEARALYRKVND